MRSKLFSGKKYLLMLVILFSTFVSVSQNNCDGDNSNNTKLSVFLDLSYWADEDYIRQQIPVVKYVRDKELADVQIIMTRHAAGQAGMNYIISLLGHGECEGMKNELRYWSASEETEHETRQGYTKMIRIGLASYVANKQNDPDVLTLQFTADTISTEATQEDDRDPWRRWIFEIYGGGYYDAEKTRNSLHIRYGFYADKVTKDWKIRARPYFNYNERNYEIEDTTVTTVTHRDGFNGYAIKSLTGHWSAGVFARVLSSTYHNMNFQLEVSPAIEYSFYPYSEATRRSISIAWKLDHSYNDYLEETILGETKEFLWGQSLVLSADYRQTWGSISAGVTGSHHFHDFNSNSLELFSELDIRVFKGFSLTFNADFEFINDLVAIPAGEMSTEEILLEQRRRSTNYQFDGHIGFTYTFGSERSGDYNPRL